MLVLVGLAVVGGLAVIEDGLGVDWLDLSVHVVDVAVGGGEELRLDLIVGSDGIDSLLELLNSLITSLGGVSVSVSMGVVLSLSFDLGGVGQGCEGKGDSECGESGSHLLDSFYFT